MKRMATFLLAVAAIPLAALAAFGSLQPGPALFLTVFWFATLGYIAWLAWNSESLIDFGSRYKRHHGSTAIVGFAFVSLIIGLISR